jgi:hypothetical protein
MRFLFQWGRGAAVRVSNMRIAGVVSDPARAHVVNTMLACSHELAITLTAPTPLPFIII